jgi:hypothetical protein
MPVRLPLKADDPGRGGSLISHGLVRFMKYLTGRLGYFAAPFFFLPGVSLSSSNLGEEQPQLMPQRVSGKTLARTAV